jgi:hypothetical protein
LAINTFKWQKSGPGKSKPSINFLFGLLVAVLMIVAAIRLWDEVEFSIKGVAASGQVLEHEQAQGSGPRGSRSCTAKLEVSQSGGPPFRTSMFDMLGHACEDGTTVALLCMHSPAGGHDCEVDSWTRWTFPLIVLGSGALYMVWRLRRALGN